MIMTIRGVLLTLQKYTLTKMDTVKVKMILALMRFVEVACVETLKLLRTIIIFWVYIIMMYFFIG